MARVVLLALLFATPLAASACGPMKFAVVHKAQMRGTAKAKAMAEQKWGNATSSEPAEVVVPQKWANMAMTQKARNATMADCVKDVRISPHWAWAWAVVQKKRDNETMIQKVVQKKAKPTKVAMEHNIRTATLNQTAWTPTMIEEIHAYEKVEPSKAAAEKKPEKVTTIQIAAQKKAEPAKAAAEREGISKILSQKVQNASVIRKVQAQKATEPASAAPEAQAPKKAKLLKAGAVQNTGNATFIIQKAESAKAAAEYQLGNVTTPTLIRRGEALAFSYYLPFA